MAFSRRCGSPPEMVNIDWECEEGYSGKLEGRCNVTGEVAAYAYCNTPFQWDIEEEAAYRTTCFVPDEGNIHEKKSGGIWHDDGCRTAIIAPIVIVCCVIVAGVIYCCLKEKLCFQKKKKKRQHDHENAAIAVNTGLPRHHRELSLTLYNILEDIGVSKETRQMKMDLWTRSEILQTIHFQSVMSCNIFGSAIEGTATLGMDSDVDQVLTFNDLHVVTNPADHPVGTCLLMVQDQTTSPGYCKLQVVHNGNALCGDHPEVTSHLPRNIHAMFKFCTDKNNRMVCSFNPPNEITRGAGRRQGPALTSDSSGSLISSDIVFSFKCNKWPECASEWLNRQRHFNWPTTEMINLCETLGCLFVPVGPPDSDEQDLMWRVSFSHQEKLLVTSFNSVQHKCYVLLKIIKKDLIAPLVPDSLSSYHIKTCMFYLIENTKFQFWSPENLLGCVVAVLTLLLKWTETGNCPNYFIRASNLFTRRVHGDVKLQLRQRLQHLLSDDCKFLVEIKTNNIGLYLNTQL